MTISAPLRKRLHILKEEFDTLRIGKESLLAMIEDTEIPENVYNSNAIENSTLTLKETERILLDMEVSRTVTVREVFEAKNLARIVQYMRKKSHETNATKDTILFLHQMLLTAIDDAIAGRFRKQGEYVRIGSHIASAPEQVESMIEMSLREYANNLEMYFIEKIAKFHAQFEHIHPFIDGNGRLGRVLINWQLRRLGFPCVIIRYKEKRLYYSGLRAYDKTRNTKIMEKVIYLALTESLHKRVTYLKGQEIIALSEYARRYTLSAPATFNSAKRQTLPAFRENGVWKIGITI